MVGEERRHELVLRLRCKRPEVAKASLEPDVRNSETMSTDMEVYGDVLEIRVNGGKISHMKAVMNSYLSVVGLLDQVDDIK